MTSAGTFFLALGASFVLNLLLIYASRRGMRFLADHDLSGPQKFHSTPVPRVGGVGIFIGTAAPIAWLEWQHAEAGHLSALLVLCALPAFLAGLVEDLTKSVSPMRRLLCTALSAGLGVVIIGAAIQRTAIPGLDWIVASSLGAALVTMLAVSGVANAVNIIDGFNGLAAMCVVLMLCSMAYVSSQVADASVFVLCLAGVGAVIGFFCWNFPLGLIFLGDGGAYFLGFFVAEVAILLLARNGEVSPFFPLLVCIYPIFETIFSIYRKKYIRGMSPGVPDGVHLHMLIYRRLIRWAVGRRANYNPRLRNSMTSPYLWIMCMLSVIPAVIFWNNTAILGIFILIFGFTYTYLYWRIVRFKTPRFLRVRRRRA